MYYGGGMGPVGFDLDMTLIDSRPAILASFAELARENDTSIDLAAGESGLGIKLEDEVAFWFPRGQLVAAAGIYRRHYVRLAEQMTTALPGAHEALAAVRAAGERVVIITAKHPVSVEPSLRAVGLTADELFTLVHGPEKAAVLRNLKAAAYVGDTPPDMAGRVDDEPLLTAALDAADAALADSAVTSRTVADAGGAEPGPDGQRRDRMPGLVPGRPHGRLPSGREACRGAQVVTLPDPRLMDDRLVVVADEPGQFGLDLGQGPRLRGLHS